MMDDLKGDQECSGFLRDFIDYIKKNMLVIDAVRRAKSPDIERALDEMYSKCKTSSDYCCISLGMNSQRINAPNNVQRPGILKKVLSKYNRKHSSSNN